jgi:hypothetical protein
VELSLLPILLSFICTFLLSWHMLLLLVLLLLRCQWFIPSRARPLV